VEKLISVENKGEVPAIEIVDLLVEYAQNNRASDIHLEPRKKDAIVRFRTDGVLEDVLVLPLPVFEQMVTRIKVASKLRTDEHLSAQDGKMQVTVPGEELDIRVSVVPIIHGEKVVLRLLSAKTRQFGLVDLGFAERDLEKVKAGFDKSFGMVLVTGPTGSGKTTSIYAILKILNTREKNIATIEDPVEYDIEGINQIQVNSMTNLTFASGLRSILRQDPNVIFVGEIRDEETAGIAVNAAMTGHLVLSTLHTNDAATTLPRLMDMKIEPYLVASTVNVISAQRLVRKICEKCKVSVDVPMEVLEKDLSKEMITKMFGKGKKTSVRLYKGKGCEVCHDSGYVGRIGMFEVLVVTEELKELIMAREDAASIRKRAIAEGMVTMLEDGIDKAKRGMTTIEEVIKATKD
jgi:type II secretory ATPase GspE/PulE/Tfp pilus assembly ATPase PilB-like protein